MQCRAVHDSAAAGPENDGLARIHSSTRSLALPISFTACMHTSDRSTPGLVLDLAVGLLGDADAAPIDRQASEVVFRFQNTKYKISINQLYDVLNIIKK